MNRELHIVISGAGPVGLFLAGRLLQHGFRCTILEKKYEIDNHSRSLGIHPVSLELFHDAGIVNQFLARGLMIRKGLAFWNRNKIGDISFDTCPAPFNFVLALQQRETEKILESWVQSFKKSSVIRGAELSHAVQTRNSVSVSYLYEKQEKEVMCDFLIGCDGKNSTVRELLGIPFRGSPYPDTYMMGDFTDLTAIGNDAAVYLHEDGLIESFPLPGGYRRWVAKTDSYNKNPERYTLEQIIDERLGYSLSAADNVMMSSFGVQHFLADSMHSGRILLAGDSAHVVSPIGGQGMNLGWLDSEACVQAIAKAAANTTNMTQIFEDYSIQRKKIARHVARRAEMNMWLGRKENSGFFTKFAAHLITKKPLSNLLAHVFTMRGLGSWPI